MWTCDSNFGICHVSKKCMSPTLTGEVSADTSNFWGGVLTVHEVLQPAVGSIVRHRQTSSLFSTLKVCDCVFLTMIIGIKVNIVRKYYEHFLYELL